MAQRFGGPLGMILLSVAVGPLACTDASNGPGSSQAGGSESNHLFRAPAISNVMEGVIWEAGNWEPHLAAGAEGVSWGNHRAVVVVVDAEIGEVTAGSPADGDAVAADSAVGNAAVGGVETGATPAQQPDAVFVTIPWRRRDADPGSKGVIVVDATSGEVIRNALALRIENASGDIAFQPNPGSSTYHVYYLPWQSSGGYYPTITYPTPAELLAATRESAAVAVAEADSPSRAQEAGQRSISWVGKAPNPDPTWEAAVLGMEPTDLPVARTTHIQSVDEFHSFFPMEVIATPEEEAAFWGVQDGSAPGSPGGDASDKGWAVVPEYRDFPIRMRHFIPRHWAEKATASLLSANTEGPGETSTEASLDTPSSEGFDTFSSPVLKDEAVHLPFGDRIGQRTSRRPACQF